MVDTADSKSVVYRFESDRGDYCFSPGNGMVDVPDLGSGIWQFKSAPGYAGLFGEMVDAVALKATFTRSASSSLAIGTLINTNAAAAIV